MQINPKPDRPWIRSIGLPLIAGILAFNLMGCLAYRTGTRPPAMGEAATVDPAQKPSVYIVTKCVSRNFIQKDFYENILGAQRLRYLTSTVLATNRFFSNYTFTSSRATNMDYRLVLTLSTQENASFAGLMFCAATLTVIPTTCEMRYAIKAELYDTAGHLIQKHDIESSMRAWFQLLLFPLGALKSPEKLEQKLIGEMVETAIKRLTWFEKEGRANADLVNDVNAKLAGKPVADS